ncbi:pur operon repressor [Lactovum miscens]|uniref:Purine operon repressor n=1 Tax=Lactovum miscens TaxID=190387 RepID=A0A841C7X2_9LACT|nr:pur operon repressor [Lactovum miscens]MBB5887651.1 purine operon repressor [Lactovum miscens]
MKRSERLVDLTNFLTENPFELLKLSTFTERYESSKSTISEDLEIIRQVFKAREIGEIKTYTGTAGGVEFIPDISDKRSVEFARDIQELMGHQKRILPGGYLYLSDIVGDPTNLKKIGRILAHEFIDARVDAVMTIATKGIPIAQATAECLNVPFVVVRRDPKVTEGATLAVNYMSGSSSKVESMVLSKRALLPGKRVLIVDDFMKGGGTLNGMRSLVYEMDCRVAGVSVFIEGPFHGERPLVDYRSMLRVDNIDLANHAIDVRLGNMFDRA